MIEMTMMILLAMDLPIEPAAVTRVLVGARARTGHSRVNDVVRVPWICELPHHHQQVDALARVWCSGIYVCMCGVGWDR